MPSKALPPLPWGLSQQGRSEAYYTGSNSILTNRILQRAPDYAAVGGSYGGSSSGGGGGADNVDAVLQQWRELTSDRSNQYQQDVHPPRNKAAGAKKQNKGSQHGRKGAFNVDRLLHPWQRDMNRMKERLKSGLPLEVEEEEEQGGGGGPDSNGADGSYGDNEDGYGNGNGQGYSSHEGDGGGDDYDDGYSDDRQIHTADHHHQQQNSGSTKSKPTRLQALSAGANAPDKSKGRRGGDKNKKQGLQDQGRGGLLPALQLNSFTSGASTNTTSTTSTTTSTSANTAVPKTSLQQLKRIEASWGTEEPASRGGAVNSSNSNTYSGNSNSSPKKLNPAIITTSTGSSSGSLSSSSGVGDGGGGLQSSAAVNRVGNALLGGLNLPADSNKPLGRVATSESIPEHHEAQISRPPVYPPRAAGGGGAGGDRDGGDDDGDDDEEGSDEEIGWSPFAVRA